MNALVHAVLGSAVLLLALASPGRPGDDPAAAPGQPQGPATLR